MQFTVWLIEKLGRRTLTVPPQWLCTVVLGPIGVWVSSQPIAVLVLFLIFSVFNAGYNTLTAIYLAEVFPTEARGIGTGFAAAVSRIGTGVGTFLLPWSMSHVGASGTMLIAAGIAGLGAALSHGVRRRRKSRA
ncbi:MULTISPECIES: MFS transporter [unclassified Burkholderia]|uniref:MFS transporter n=1 Tax=unclassified Burkholderia TaxID=2613784 RepID=UPI002AB2B3B5|nr:MULTISPECIES: MFS transporter [unclassified Burkholderia]